jgi:prepilin-type N-terminal cleavage/methylation domain-containing protein
MRRGLTLVELLITITIIAILAAVAIPSLEPGKSDTLSSAAQIVQSDLAYGRSLAIAHGTPYRFTFELTGNRYVLTHAGTNPDFDDLPEHPYKSSDDTSRTQSTRLAELPFTMNPIRIVAVQTITSAGVIRSTDRIEFNALGATASADRSRIWLGVGSGTQALYLPIEVDAASGVTSLGALTRAAPSASAPIRPAPIDVVPDSAPQPLDAVNVSPFAKNRSPRASV